MSHQPQEQMTDQLAELTSLCQFHDADDIGTLDKTLVRTHAINSLQVAYHTL